jgi:hypothetical protein
MVFARYSLGVSGRVVDRNIEANGTATKPSNFLIKAGQLEVVQKKFEAG